MSGMPVRLGICMFPIDRDDGLHGDTRFAEGTLIRLLKPNVETAPAELQQRKETERQRDTMSPTGGPQGLDPTTPGAAAALAAAALAAAGTAVVAPSLLLLLLLLSAAAASVFVFVPR